MFRFANDEAKQWRTVWLAATQQVVGLLAQFGFGCHMLPLLSTNRNLLLEKMEKGEQPIHFK